MAHGSLTAVIQLLDWVLCSSAAHFTLVQGCLVLLAAAVGWVLSARARREELQRQLAAHKTQLHVPAPLNGRIPAPKHAASEGAEHSCTITDALLATAKPANGRQNGLAGHLKPAPPPAALDPGVAPSGPLPGVSVVLPVKGCRHFAEHNWRSQLELQYPGPLEFVFVSHSTDDIAFHTIEKLLKSLEPALGSTRARVLASGHTTGCSQKIHNLCHGIAAASAASKYVLCIDDDVQLHRDTLHALVTRLEADPSLFLATGVPFDVPAPGSGLLTYCMLVYHLPILIAFSVREVTFNVWGGCMLMPLKHLRQDTHGIMHAWRNGGYSDDLTVAAKCNQHKLRIFCPGSAIFVQHLEPRVTCAKFWNYLRRQTYVLDTYSDRYNQRMNWGLMAFSACANVFAAATMMLAGTRAIATLASILVLPWLAVSAPDNDPTVAALINFITGSTCPAVALTTAGAWVVMVTAYVSCKLFCESVIRLLNALSPTRDPLPLNAISQPMVWMALLIQCVLQPVCVLATLLIRDIEWSGIKYWKRNGRITHIQSAGEKVRACPNL